MTEKSKAEIVLRFIPEKGTISISLLKELLKKWAPEISERDLDEIITKLLEEGIISEPKPLEYQRIPIITKEKEKPIYKAYFPLGEGQGISVTLWKNNLQLQRRERINNEWKTTQEINLARQVLEKLYIRLPYLFYLMKKKS